MNAGHYVKKVGGDLVAPSLQTHRDVDGERCHRFTRLVLDRWALDEPNRVRLLCADLNKLEWLLDAAQEQGNIELELLTSVEAQRRREWGETDSDLLLDSGLSLGMPDLLPFQCSDK
ncbi:hypothetical protein ACT3TC_16480 [Halomonas sp. AOP27-A1-41]|uniref:hypothetical protein n=1 Tax=Halomonas sp. AOP27-A1-41 TaxID=3457707 RepID=UPI0040349879